MLPFQLELHSGDPPQRLLCNANSKEGQIHLGSASVYLPPFSLALPWNCTRWTSTAMLTCREDKYTEAESPSLSTLHWSFNSSSRPWVDAISDQVQFGQVQVQLKVFGGSPRATPLKSNSVKLKSDSASPRWISIWPHSTWAQVGEVHVRLLMDFT